MLLLSFPYDMPPCLHSSQPPGSPQKTLAGWQLSDETLCVLEARQSGPSKVEHKALCRAVHQAKAKFRWCKTTATDSFGNAIRQLKLTNYSLAFRSSPMSGPASKVGMPSLRKAALTHGFLLQREQDSADVPEDCFSESRTDPVA